MPVQEPEPAGAHARGAEDLHEVALPHAGGREDAHVLAHHRCVERNPDISKFALAVLHHPDLDIPHNLLQKLKIAGLRPLHAGELSRYRPWFTEQAVVADVAERCCLDQDEDILPHTVEMLGVGACVPFRVGEVAVVDKVVHLCKESQPFDVIGDLQHIPEIEPLVMRHCKPVTEHPISDQPVLRGVIAVNIDQTRHGNHQICRCSRQGSSRACPGPG